MRSDSATTSMSVPGGMTAHLFGERIHVGTVCILFAARDFAVLELEQKMITVVVLPDRGLCETFRFNSDTLAFRSDASEFHSKAAWHTFEELTRKSDELRAVVRPG